MFRRKKEYRYGKNQGSLSIVGVNKRGRLLTDLLSLLALKTLFLVLKQYHQTVEKVQKSLGFFLYMPPAIAGGCLLLASLAVEICTSKVFNFWGAYFQNCLSFFMRLYKDYFSYFSKTDFVYSFGVSFVLLLKA